MHVLDEPMLKARSWIAELANDLGVDEQRAWLCLRAGLHALRDRLSVDEAAQLGAQLPLIVRGLWYEGWHPAHKPLRIRTRAELFERIHHELSGVPESPALIARALFRLLDRHVTEGEIAKIQHVLPEDLQQLWRGA